MTIRLAFLGSTSCVLAGTLLSSPVMALRLAQSPEQAPTETASKVQGMAGDSAGAKESGATRVDGELAPGKRPKGSQAETAAAKARSDGTANDNGNAAAANGSAATSSTGAPPSPQQAKGAAPKDEQLRKDSLNPISNLISFPFQHNSNMRIEPADRNQNVLNIQPVIPVSLNENWQLVIRWITPVIWQPIPDKKELGFYGLGDMLPTFFLVPKKPAFGKLIWGVGPALLIPTATNAFLGQGKLCIGPSVAVLSQPGPWTIGVLVNNVWSVAPANNRANVNQMLLQYFITYNMAKGWYITSQPILTADWKAAPGDRWVVPFGGGVGRIMRLGVQPVNIRVQAFGNYKRPEDSATWQLRLEFALLFPTGKH